MTDKKLLSQVSKVLIKNVIRHTDSHNKVVEENDMWRQRQSEVVGSGSSFLKDRRRDMNSEFPNRRTRKAHMDEEPRGTYWMNELYKAEEADDNRWGHSGFKELYPEQFKHRRDPSIHSESSSSSHKDRGHKKKKKKHKRNKLLDTRSRYRSSSRERRSKKRKHTHSHQEQITSNSDSDSEVDLKRRRSDSDLGPSVKNSKNGGKGWTKHGMSHGNGGAGEISSGDSSTSASDSSTGRRKLKKKKKHRRKSVDRNGHSGEESQSGERKKRREKRNTKSDEMFEVI